MVTERRLDEGHQETRDVAASVVDPHASLLSPPSARSPDERQSSPYGHSLAFSRPAAPILNRSQTSGFSAQSHVIFDKWAGITYTNPADTFANGKPVPSKILHYNMSQVLGTMSPWYALVSEMSFNATALASRTLSWRCGFFLLVSAIVVFAALLSPVGLNEPIVEAVEDLNKLFNSGMLFLLGPFVARSISRWWSIREGCIGKLWSSVNTLSSYAAAWFYTDSASDTAARELTMRYGLASHALLYKRARGGGEVKLEDMDDLVDAGLLMPYEAEVLAPLPCKAQVVWAWQTHFWSKAISGELGCTKVPQPGQAFGIAARTCQEARDAIQKGLMFLGTQQPFPYVHMISLIVDVALFLNALYVGCDIGRSFDADNSPIQSGLLIAIGILRVLIFTFLYNGLSDISVALEDPFGTDMADLPALAFQTHMRGDCQAFGAAVAAVDRDQGWWPGFEEKKG